jgi:cytidyltransferase-like protein
MNINDFNSCWYIVQILQLGLLRHHVKAFKRGYLHFPTLTGPDAAFVWFGLITLIHILSDENAFDFLRNFFHVESLLSLAYWSLLIYSAFEAATLPFSSRNGILFCLLYRSTPGLLRYFGLAHDESLVGIICDGLFMAMITTDMIVGRKAGRDLHPWIVLFAMASLLNNFLTLFLISFYFISLFYEISQFLNLPLFTTVINVYCDGIYDLCHLGHKVAFQNALQFGNRLFVGVCSDEDASVYKRRPIMTTQERCDAVAACKCVYAVIPNAPCHGISEEFIRKHNIHIVAHGEVREI